MELKYELTKDETAFLKALHEKPFPNNRWSGRGCDDDFRRQWRKEIIAFIDNGLTEKKNEDPEAYWEYGLNINGLGLQENVLNNMKKDEPTQPYSVYILWGGNSHVYIGGHIEPDHILGVFTSIDEMNDCTQQRSFYAPIDMKGKEFTEDTKRFEVDGKFGNVGYCYYEEWALNDY